jgi:prolipoprotein diacylglyceryltransferase
VHASGIVVVFLFLFADKVQRLAVLVPCGTRLAAGGKVKDWWGLTKVFLEAVRAVDALRGECLFNVRLASNTIVCVALVVVGNLTIALVRKVGREGAVAVVVNNGHNRVTFPSDARAGRE